MYQNITNMKIYKSEGVEIPLAIGYNVIESPYGGGFGPSGGGGSSYLNFVIL